MSALFGLFHLNGQPVQKQDFKRMSQVLAPYGPEREGIWMEGNVGLGHRLICFTPQDRFERQPLVHSSRKWVLVFDGRLDNRQELIHTLDINTEEAPSMPDSRLVGYAYEKWGEQCVHHLIGSFVFAFWDIWEKELFLARSPVNKRALFYHKTSHCFAFSSMPKGLFQLPHVPREIDEEVLADYLAMAPPDPKRTFYQHIYRLPSGHWMRVNPNRLNIGQYWKPDIYSEIRYPQDNDYVEAFKEKFHQAVKSRLRSLTPVGVMMSGGLDSSSVAVTAASMLGENGKRLTAFTEVPQPGFKGPIGKNRYADETPFVREIARGQANLNLNLVRTDGRFYLEGLDSFFEAAEGPFPNASNRLYIEAILNQAQKQKIGVVLEGVQGNLTMSWQGSGLLSNLIYQKHWLQALHEAQAISHRGNACSTWRVLMAQGIMPLLPTPLWSLISSLRGKENKGLYSSSPPWAAYSPLNPIFAREKKVEARAHRKGHDFRFRLKRDTRALRFKTMTCFETFDILWAGYQALFGTETRDPTADTRIIEFCLSLPEEQFLHHGVSRSLIRRAMKGRLPSSVLWKKKRGLQTADWFERIKRAQAQIQETLKDIEKSPLASQALDIPRLWKLVENLPDAGSSTDEFMLKYRKVLESGLMTGCFIRWVEKGI